MSSKKRFRELRGLLEKTKKSKPSEQLNFAAPPGEKNLPANFRDKEEEQDELLSVEVIQNPRPKEHIEPKEVENKFEKVIFSEGFGLKDEFVIEEGEGNMEDDFLDLEEQGSPESLDGIKNAFGGGEPMVDVENIPETKAAETHPVEEIDEVELNLRILADEEAMADDPKAIHRLDETVQQSTEQKKTAIAEEVEEDPNGIPTGFFDDQKIEAQKTSRDLALEETRKRDIDVQMKELQKAIKVDEDMMKKKLLDEDVARNEETYVDDIQSKLEALARLNQIQTQVKEKLNFGGSVVENMEDVNEGSSDDETSFDIDWQSRRNTRR